MEEEEVFVSQPKLCICRYSQFLQLHQALVTRHHGQALRGFRFPKKQLTNNFRPDILEERRLAFRSDLECLNMILGKKSHLPAHYFPQFVILY